MRLILVVIMMILVGCSSMRTKDTARTETKNPAPRLLSSDILNEEEIPVNQTVLDRIRSHFPWNKARTPLSPTTIRIMNDYLEDNELEALNIEFQTETPKDDWNRLEANTSINPLLKYSLGSFDWLSNKITKPSFWGRNYYDPYTNTMHINSNNNLEIMAEMSYAKIIQRQSYPGLYALGKATIRKMYPGMLNGSSKDIGRVAGLFFGPFYLRPAISVGGVLVGYTVAEWEISQRENEIIKVGYPQKQENPLIKTDSQIERASYVK
jgi:hypothetical protein